MCETQMQQVVAPNNVNMKFGREKDRLVFPKSVKKVNKGRKGGIWAVDSELPVTTFV